MTVSGVGSRKTGELVDEWAHDAGVVDAKHHVSGSTSTKSGAELHRERNADGTVREAAKTVAIGVGKEVAPEVVAHELATRGIAKAFGADILALPLAVGIQAYECLHELSAAEKKADEIRAAFDNDAVNVALARSLAFDRCFGELEAAKRPGVEIAGAKLSLKLNEPGNPMKATFQGRADEGFDAARRAEAATCHLPPGERPAAFTKWMSDNGFGERFKNDVAFGKGVEYFAWIHTKQAHELGVDTVAEIQKVEARRIPPQVFRAAG